MYIKMEIPPFPSFGGWFKRWGEFVCEGEGEVWGRKEGVGDPLLQS